MTLHGDDLTKRQGGIYRATVPAQADPTLGMTHAEIARRMTALGFAAVLTAAGPRPIDEWARSLEWADQYIRLFAGPEPNVVHERRPDGGMTEGLAYGVWTFLKQEEVMTYRQPAL